MSDKKPGPVEVSRRVGELEAKAIRLQVEVFKVWKALPDDSGELLKWLALAHLRIGNVVDQLGQVIKELARESKSS